MHVIRMIIIGASLPAVSPAKSANIESLSGPEACKRLMERMGVHDGVSPDKLKQTWFCGTATDSKNDHPDWLVIALRSFRECDGFCSNLRGWFAVNRNTGEVREWNVGEWMIGKQIGQP